MPPSREMNNITIKVALPIMGQPERLTLHPYRNIAFRELLKHVVPGVGFQIKVCRRRRSLLAYLAWCNRCGGRVGRVRILTGFCFGFTNSLPSTDGKHSLITRTKSLTLRLGETPPRRVGGGCSSGQDIQKSFHYLLTADLLSP